MRYLLGILFLVSLFACKTTSVNKKTIIGIQPIGSYNKEVLKPLSNKIEEYYGVKTVVLNPIEIPESFFINIKSPRYRADSIIHYLRANKPDSLSYILGITSKDISSTKRDENGDIRKPTAKYTDWGIFGLGFRPGSSCVVSTYRMGNNNALKIERAQKVALHELGHNLGLKHCPNLKCFMQDGAESIKTVDKVNFNLCDKCKTNL